MFPVAKKNEAGVQNLEPLPHFCHELKSLARETVMLESKV
jgi:hypothetical protein